MTHTVLVTTKNWFDLPRLAASGDPDGSRELTLTDSDGRCPLADVPLDELRALHHTLGAWWSALGGGDRPASLKAGEYDRFLSESRALLRRKAEAAFASDGPAQASTSSFPGSCQKTGSLLK